MKKLKLLATLVFSVLISLANGQSLQEQFYKSFSEQEEPSKQLKILQQWEQEGDEKAELYIAYFNYYLNQGRSEVIAIGDNPQGGAYAIMSQDETIDEPIAYMYGDVSFDPELISKAFDWIDKGIAKFPKRLDMRFGKITLLSMIGDYNNFTTNIIQTIDYSASEDNVWLWEDDAPIDNSMFFDAIQDYQFQLYNIGRDDLLPCMIEIAETVLKYYPDNVESISNISVVYILQENYDKALEYMIKAEKINPKDEVVLANIATLYVRMGNKEGAIEYYQKLIEHGNDDLKQQAQEALKELE